MTLIALNVTHDPKATSWLGSANGSDFPIQNLAYGRCRPQHAETLRCGVAIGDKVLDVAQLASQTEWLKAPGVDTALATLAAQAAAEDLRKLMRMGAPAWHALRVALFLALHRDASVKVQQELELALHALSDVELATAVQVGEYTDFYTSFYHARNVGIAVGRGGDVSPNFFWMPIAYHGRASSLGLNSSFRRPMGQAIPPGQSEPVFGECQRLDYELEMAIYVGQDNAWGQPVSMAQSESHIFGMGLLNDWSARDIQFWEMTPLGPFQGKNFATSLSPWIVTMEALAPFRLPFAREATYPQPLAYLDGEALRDHGGIDVNLSVSLQTAQMRSRGLQAQQISQTNFKHQHWCVSQMLVQHTIGGCNLHAGDVLGTGTISGPTPEEAGAIIELAHAGQKPISLATGEKRAFLSDGDVVVLRGTCEREGAVRIGFGECRGEVLPSIGA
ncbi:MAG: fumarylacetoacetase [Burkholderiales bacterium]|nr:fumarylacetoacetase [Burkholderiales bacterium]